jgi:glycosyltransferase involved in cell wall biosynthesis
VVLGEEGPLVSRLRIAGVPVEVLPMASAARNLSRTQVRPGSLPVLSALRSASYVVRLARRLRALQPDLVHTNSLKSALYGGAAGRLTGLPVVWHIRDRIADDYMPRSAVRLVRAAARWLPDVVIANSHSTLNTLGKHVNRTVIASPVIYDPVSGARAHRSRSEEELCVGMVGRIAPWKGQHVFIEAFAHAFPAGRERAVIVGAPLFGEAEYEARLRELVASLGLESRVEFAGFREDVERELARFDVLVHSSVIPEPFGQVVIEGMAGGLPVIAPAAGGPAEVIEDGVNGLLYPPGDANGLARRLRQVAASARLRADLGSAAREKATQFEPSVIAAQVTYVYNEVLARRRRD